jgi:hypothetical protein
MRLSRLLRPAFPARYPFVVLALLSLLVGAFAIWYGVHYTQRTASAQDATITQLRTQLQASCAFAADVGSVALPASPRPSRLGVLIVSDARSQWRKLHCPGSLAPAPGLARWAAYYHLPGS